MKQEEIVERVVTRLYDGLAAFDTVFSTVTYARRTPELGEKFCEEAEDLCQKLHVGLTGLIQLIKNLED